MSTPNQLREMTADELIEAVAQMLYDKAELASEQSSQAITQPMREKYETEYLTYCAAAEYTRRMIDPL